MKFMGSKSRIAKYIAPIIQDCIDQNHITTYIEPFIGGANVIDKINCKHRIGSDLNPYLIGLLQYVSNGGTLLDEVPRELYAEVRSNYKSGQYEDWYVGNIGFLASYNGRWFDGGYANPGYEKTKNGIRYRDYYQEAKRNLIKQAENLQRIQFMCCDYRQSYSTDLNGCFYYFDPPYANTKQFANSLDFDYDEFWDFVRQVAENNYILVSELQAPDDFTCIWSQNVSRSIKATDKSKAVERLFVYNKSPCNVVNGVIEY